MRRRLSISRSERRMLSNSQSVSQSGESVSDLEQQEEEEEEE